MTPADLAALHAQVFTVPRPFTAAEFGALLDSPSVFLCDGEHGFALGRAIAGEVELLTLAVAPKVQRQGHGDRLLQAFLDTARQRHGQVAFLEVDETNAPAIALYVKHGFADVGRRKGYYHHADGRATDALVMRRELADHDGL